jgi:hypothetical protein
MKDEQSKYYFNKFRNTKFKQFKNYWFDVQTSNEDPLMHKVRIYLN